MGDKNKCLNPDKHLRMRHYGLVVCEHCYEDAQQRIKELEEKCKSEYKRGNGIARMMFDEKLVAENKRLEDAIEDIADDVRGIVELMENDAESEYANIVEEIASKLDKALKEGK